MNRIADADSTSSTQLEASYPEANQRPLHRPASSFQRSQRLHQGIKDYASTTRVITANGNASTTSATTQLGMGNAGAFDGTGDYFEVPDSDGLEFWERGFSVDFWVRNSNILNQRDSFFLLFQG